MGQTVAAKMMPLEILFEDSDLIAINKPPHLASIPGRGESTSVIEHLAAQLNLPYSGTADPRLRVVHRLDKDTSGVLLFAKNLAAQRHLSHQFQNNTIKKEYLALVSGKPPQSCGDIDAPLAPHPVQKDRMHISKHGRPARTLWQVEQSFRRHALLRVFPQTGKTHQIRVHLKSIDLPLAVDPLYGSSTELFLSSFKRDYRPNRGQDERPLISRLTLHAHKLTFEHPNGATINLEAPLPKDFRATINQLQRHGSR
jgi:23S rRNA pseudouridine1911/1915/1917 synthase